MQCINNLTDFYKIYPIYLTKDNKFFLSNHLKPKDYLNKEEVVKKSKEVSFFNNALYKAKKNSLKKLADLDGVINCCHGGVGENGILCSYLQMNNLKTSSANCFSSAICMNKHATKLWVREVNIPVVDWVYVDKTNYDKIDFKNLNDNIIIKANGLGSSIGVIKSNKEKLNEDLMKVLHLDDSAVVENCILDMEEFNCAVLRKGDDICLSLIEKPASKSDILSFEDKYCSVKSKREIPAKISKELESKIYEYSKKIYESLGLSGVVRIDYIYDKSNEILYMNEVNTIPGSLAFYLFEGLGIDYAMLCDILLENAKIDIKKETYFESDILTKTSFQIK